MAADNQQVGGADHSQPLTRPQRPTISLPPRPAFNFAAAVSPGPMTLVSRLFSEEADSDYQSFSQLLAGVIASSPVAGRGEMDGYKVPSLSSLFTVPGGLSPAGLLGSPELFPTSPGPFGISHQEALAQVTAQAASNSHMFAPSASPESASAAVSLAQPTFSAANSALVQDMPITTKDAATAISSLCHRSYADQRSQSSSFNASKPADDGYNWRKYGQKQVKKSEFPRGYYKCTFPNCAVTKKVEHALDGQVTEIIYKGQHNHERPPPGRRVREASTFSTELNGISDMTKTSSNFQSQNLFKLNEGAGQVTTENLSGSSDGEEVAKAEMKIDETDEIEPTSKRIKGIDNGEITDVSSQKTHAEPVIIVQTTSEVDLLDDGYRWRKYGQKVVKGNPNPRSYYRCTFPGCNVRKHVERASTDLRDVITTYEGKHNHDTPTARNSGPNTTSANSINIIQPKAMHAAKHRQPVAAVRPPKEEYYNT